MKILKDQKKHENNPFLSNLKVPLTPKSNHILAKNEAVVNVITGEMKEDILLTARRKYVDGDQFVKIFVNEMGILFSLSKAAQKVFTYLASQTSWNDQVIFNLEKCKEMTHYKSHPQIFKGLAELCDKEFIAKSINVNVYWINPQIFYKGDRLVVLKEYRKIKRKGDINNPNQTDLFKDAVAESKLNYD